MNDTTVRRLRELEERYTETVDDAPHEGRDAHAETHPDTRAAALTGDAA